MPAFGKNGIVNIGESKSTPVWNVIKDGKVVKVCSSEEEANTYKGTLIISGVDKSHVVIKQAKVQCL